MKAISKWAVGAAAAAMAGLASAPAQAQYYDPYYDRNRSSTVEVVAGVAAVAGIVAAASAAAQGRYYDPYRGPGHGWDRGFERHAASACAFEAERRFSRYGRVRANIRNVQYLRHDRVRVLGMVDLPGRGWDRRWDGVRTAFTCEVRVRDGRVTSFRTHNYRW